MSGPDEHLRLPRSLDGNSYLAYLGGIKSAEVIKLAEVLAQTNLQSLR